VLHTQCPEAGAQLGLSTSSWALSSAAVDTLRACCLAAAHSALGRGGVVWCLPLCRVWLQFSCAAMLRLAELTAPRTEKSVLYARSPAVKTTARRPD